MQPQSGRKTKFRKVSERFKRRPPRGERRARLRGLARRRYQKGALK